MFTTYSPETLFAVRREMAHLRQQYHNLRISGLLNGLEYIQYHPNKTIFVDDLERVTGVSKQTWKGFHRSRDIKKMTTEQLRDKITIGQVEAPTFSIACDEYGNPLPNATVKCRRKMRTTLTFVP